MQPVFTRSVFRFAPSPNGYLHLGHAYSALLNVQAAQAMGGRFLLRIEDIDVQRCREDLIEACYEDLAWLGLRWEQPVLRQSAHFGRYQAALDRLSAQGLLYACTCTRADLVRAAGEVPLLDPDGGLLYPGLCRAHPQGSGKPAALRLDMNKALALHKERACLSTPLCWQEARGALQLGLFERHLAEPARWGDVVLQRKDVPTSYHLSVVLDDALQGITHVVRGQDLLEATAIHRLLQDLLGLPAPVYHHHALIKGEDGKKLSKSLASTPLRDLRIQGTQPQDVRAMLGFSAFEPNPG